MPSSYLALPVNACTPPQHTPSPRSLNHFVRHDRHREEGGDVSRRLSQIQQMARGTTEATLTRF